MSVAHVLLECRMDVRSGLDVAHLYQLPDDVPLFLTQSVLSLSWHGNTSCVYSLTEDVDLQNF